jgi:hypothetical protein
MRLLGNKRVVQVLTPIVKFGNSKKEIMSRARDIMSVCEAIQKGKK